MAEKEYIEREAAIEQIRLVYCKDCNNYNGVRCRACNFDDAMSAIEDAPAADVVEVVRCKDCKHWEPMDNGISWHNQGRTDGMCEMLYRIHYSERHLTSAEHFCSYGEKKERK